MPGTLVEHDPGTGSRKVSPEQSAEALLTSWPPAPVLSLSLVQLQVKLHCSPAPWAPLSQCPPSFPHMLFVLSSWISLVWAGSLLTLFVGNIPLSLISYFNVSSFLRQSKHVLPPSFDAILMFIGFTTFNTRVFHLTIQNMEVGYIIQSPLVLCIHNFLI